MKLLSVDRAHAINAWLNDASEIAGLAEITTTAAAPELMALIVDSRRWKLPDDQKHPLRVALQDSFAVRVERIVVGAMPRTPAIEAIQGCIMGPSDLQNLVLMRRKEAVAQALQTLFGWVGDTSLDADLAFRGSIFEKRLGILDQSLPDMFESWYRWIHQRAVSHPPRERTRFPTGARTLVLTGIARGNGCTMLSPPGAVAVDKQSWQLAAALAQALHDGVLEAPGVVATGCVTNGKVSQVMGSAEKLDAWRIWQTWHIEGATFRLLVVPASGDWPALANVARVETVDAARAACRVLDPAAPSLANFSATLSAAGSAQVAAVARLSRIALHAGDLGRGARLGADLLDAAREQRRLGELARSSAIVLGPTWGCGVSPDVLRRWLTVPDELPDSPTPGLQRRATHHRRPPCAVPRGSRSETGVSPLGGIWAFAFCVPSELDGDPWTSPSPGLCLPDPLLRWCEPVYDADVTPTTQVDPEGHRTVESYEARFGCADPAVRRAALREALQDGARALSNNEAALIQDTVRWLFDALPHLPARTVTLLEYLVANSKAAHDLLYDLASAAATPSTRTLDELTESEKEQTLFRLLLVDRMLGNHSTVRVPLSLEWVAARSQHGRVAAIATWLRYWDLETLIRLAAGDARSLSATAIAIGDAVFRGETSRPAESMLSRLRNLA